MSIAGRRSNQGDEYQLRVALHWLIRLLEDSSIRGIQVDSTGIPGQDFSVVVDDIVILYNNDSVCFIQVKKNQPEHEAWSLSDKVLKEELCKARDQLESHDNSEIKFYSRSPFGKLKVLVENCNRFPDFLAFQRDAAKNWSTSLKQVAKILARSEEETFSLVQRFSFGPTYEFDDWDRQNSVELDRLVPRADLTMPVLERYLANHEACLRDSKHVITRDEVWADLRELGLSLTPKRSEAEVLATFKLASRVGRHWLRTIDGEKIPRVELSQLIELIDQGSRTILLTDRPGSGKTCLILDLADELEKTDSPYGLLFIKGDQFTEINSEQDLIVRGLPEDIVGQCARLAGFRHVVVVIDSLDVLSLSRKHSALKVFLGLMDRLEKIENVTIIAACRSFDIEYDPLLRGRLWQQTIHIQPLDFETVVIPFLIRWEINPTSLSTELRELLQLPQHLRIYEKLAKLGKVLVSASAYQLYESFLEEIVVQNPLLGGKAMIALQSMADRLMEQKRKDPCNRIAFEANEEVVRQLISQEVLWDPSPGTLNFSHQTLADCLIVRSALAKNKTLEGFILDHPQLHFIRPAVRAFFFFLRAHQPDSFRKQVWQALSNGEISYHVKRLICESLAEIVPVEDDWRLLRRIFHTYPDLFRRMFVRIQQVVWLNFLKQHWFTEAQALENREDWLRQFCWKLSIWVNECPIEVIALWREAIASNWVDKQSLIRIILSGLENLKTLNIEGVQELLETLVQSSDSDKDFLGKLLSQWVQAINSGDDLLWRYITRDISPEDVQHWGLRDKLHCLPHDFHNDNFLEERLKQSDQLLALILRDLKRWSKESSVAMGYEEKELRGEFLRDSSWRFRHSQNDMYSVDGLTEVLSGIEVALKHRASQNSSWWQLNEPHLRATKEISIRYSIIQAYKENIEANIIGIEFQLQDEELLCESELNYELGELMRMSYPYISASVQSINQTNILSLCITQENDVDNLSIWKSYKAYNLLIWLPSIFRSPESQNFINIWQDRFGYSQPKPEIYSWGGIVMPPLSKENLFKLSEKSLLRLLHYYEQYPSQESFDRDMMSGFRDVVYVLREACSLYPVHFLDLFSDFIEANLHEDYIHAVVEGTANHLRYRFGNLRPNSGKAWTPIEPLPDGKTLAATLLNLLERYSIIWKGGRTVSQALEACCDILDDSESADRLTLLLFWACSKVPGDERNSISDNESDLVSRALNSTRGVIAKSAMKLFNRLLEKDQSLPELLPYLLHRFAHDSAIYARIPILEQLPFLLYKQPDLGWRLLSNVFQESQPRLWKHAEQCLYYQYRDHFHQVAPYLNRLLDEGREEAGDTWGRISTLASLAGHISQEALFEALTTANDEAWKGVAQVFAANLERREHTAICHSGLINTLHHGNLSNEAIRKIETCFRDEAKRRLIQPELALAFLDRLSRADEKHSIRHFLEWLSHEARRDPLFTLDVAEILAEKLETKMRSHQIWHTQPLITALNEILREADETDDPELIKRAINLQDRFLRLDIHGIEELFDRAGQL